MSFASALYQGAWLPCRVLSEDLRTGSLEVSVTDRTGTHEVWLRPEQVRGYTRGSPTPRGERAGTLGGHGSR